MVLSPLIFKEKLTIYKIVGFLIVLCGVCFINGNTLNEHGDALGLLCGLFSAVMYSLMVIFNKKATDISGLENAMFQLSFSFIMVAMYMGFKQGLTMEISSINICPVMILGLFNTGIGCYFYFSSISNLPVQSVAICGYLEPLSAVLLSCLLLKETMLPMQIIGAVLILSGAVFSELFKMAPKSR